MIVLRMVFKSDTGKQVTVSFQHAEQTSDSADIRVLVDKLIEYNIIFLDGLKPVEFVGAEYLITDKVPISGI